LYGQLSIEGTRTVDLSSYPGMELVIGHGTEAGIPVSGTTSACKVQVRQEDGFNILSMSPVSGYVLVKDAVLPKSMLVDIEAPRFEFKLDDVSLALISAHPSPVQGPRKWTFVIVLVLMLSLCGLVWKCGP